MDDENQKPQKLRKEPAFHTINRYDDIRWNTQHPEPASLICRAYVFFVLFSYFPSCQRYLVETTGSKLSPPATHDNAYRKEIQMAAK